MFSIPTKIKAFARLAKFCRPTCILSDKNCAEFDQIKKQHKNVLRNIILCFLDTIGSFWLTWSYFSQFLPTNVAVQHFFN